MYAFILTLELSALLQWDCMLMDLSMFSIHLWPRNDWNRSHTNNQVAFDLHQSSHTEAISVQTTCLFRNTSAIVTICLFAIFCNIFFPYLSCPSALRLLCLGLYCCLAYITDSSLQTKEQQNPYYFKHVRCCIFSLSLSWFFLTQSKYLGERL